MNKKETSVRVKKINLFLKSNGIVNYFLLFVFMFLTFELFFILIMFLEYKFISHTDLDILEIWNLAGGDFIIIQKYLILNFLDNTILGDINRWLNTNFYIKNYIDYGNFKINFLGKIEILISIILTFLIFSLVILQIKDQIKYTDMGYFSLYSPIFLGIVFFSRYYKKYHFSKVINEIRNDMTNQKKDRDFIQHFFNKDEIFLNNNIDDIILKEEKIHLLWGFYPLNRYFLEVKQNKRK